MTTSMTCDECRQAIAVADLTDWGDMDGVAAHCRACETCAAVVTDVRDSARRVAELLDGLPAGVPSALVARRAAAAAAIERERRRRRWRTLVVPLAAAAVAIPVVMVGWARPKFPEHHVVLRCLTGEQAATLAMPVLGRKGHVAIQGNDGPRVLKLGGPPELVGEAEQLIRQLDNESSLMAGTSCVLPDHAMMEQAHAMDEARAAMEQDMARAQQEAERAHQEVERARQEAERARQEAERARQDALSHRR